MKRLFSAVILCSVGLFSPRVLCQKSQMVPLQVEAAVGWNHFTHSGVNQDMQIIRDSTHYSYGIPFDNFGRAPNFSLMVSTPLLAGVSAGISVQYCITDSYYPFTGGTLTAQTVTEIEYSLSRFSPQAFVQYSLPLDWDVPSVFAIRVFGGPTFVRLRKDFYFAFAPISPSLPFLLLPTALHIRGGYEAVNPEVGANISFGVQVLQNVRLGGFVSGVFSPSKTVSGSFGSVVLQEIRSNEQFKEVYLRDVSLKYTGYTVGGSLEFGL